MSTLQSIEYIIKTRAIAYNKGGRPKLNKSSLADLYFAAEFLIADVRKTGSEQENKALGRILENYKKYFD
jgi:hypothetical protein